MPFDCAIFDLPLAGKPARSAMLGAMVFGVMFLPTVADAAPSLDLLDLQVFAKQSIEAEHSDYQGPTAAGQRVQLSDFEIGGDLTSGREVSFLRGEVKGLVRSPATHLSQVFSSGPGSFDTLALELASVKLDLLSARLSALPVTSRAFVDRTTNPGSGTTNLRIDARRPIEVVDLSANQLFADKLDHRNIMLKGDSISRLVVRIYGKSVRIRDLGMSIVGSLSPSQIVFFFPDATDLEITSSGGAMSESGQSWGIPGSVVAPNASLRFTSAVITGRVFVKDIVGSGLESGQVDRMPSAHPGAPDKQPPELLRLMSDGGFEALVTDSRGQAPEFGLEAQGGSARCSPVRPRADLLTGTDIE